MLIQWKDSYRTGIQDVDHEHQELIELINQLHDETMRSGVAERIVAMFGDLLRAISAHFALEERQMQEARYEGFRAHKTDHEALLDDLRDMMDAFEKDRKPLDSQALGVALDRWFTTHFATHDSLLHRALGPHHHH